VKGWRGAIVRRREWILVAAIVLVAALYRYPALGTVPPGLNFDEGGEGVAAMDVWNGHYRIWWPIGGGKEPLMAYLVQPFLRMFGFTPVALRAYTATLGVIAVLGTWWLARELFANPYSVLRTPYSLLPTSYSLLPTSYSLLPTLAALGLATAFWHVAYSRIAFRALAMPAVEALAMAWLWRALRTSEAAGEGVERWGHFAGAGVFIGLGAYTYLAGRFVPLALLLFFAVEAALAWRRGERPLALRHFRGLALSAGIALLVFSPLALFFARNPSAFVERAGSVSVFNPAWNQGDLWGTLLRTALTTLGTFAALTGDPNPIGNLPGRPMLGLPLALLFWLGVALSLWRVAQAIRRPPTPDPRLPTPDSLLPTPYSLLPTPYLLLLCWWPVMLLPGILAPEGAPHHLRIIGTAPATYTLVAVGLAQIGEWANQQVTNRKWQAASKFGHLRFADLLILVFLPIGLVTARDYFVRWPKLPELYMAYDVYAVELAEQMEAETDPTTAYLIPMDLRAGHEARHYTLDFLYRGDVPYYYLPVDETTVAEGLTGAAAGHTTLRVVRWRQDKHAAADEREVVTFLLATTARLVGEETYPVYRIETWALPSAHTRFALPPIEREVGVAFGGVLRLEAADVSTVGETVAVALRWAPLAAMDADYKVSLRLVAADGRVAAQKDRFLRHNWHQGTSLWPPETVNEYYLLPPVPPGEYELRVVVYHPETLAPLAAEGGVEASLGLVQVE